jgi:hypothetical protein
MKQRRSIRKGKEKKDAPRGKHSHYGKHGCEGGCRLSGVQKSSADFPAGNGNWAEEGFFVRGRGGGWVRLRQLDNCVQVIIFLLLVTIQRAGLGLDRGLPRPETGLPSVRVLQVVEGINFPVMVVSKHNYRGHNRDLERTELSTTHLPMLLGLLTTAQGCPARKAQCMHQPWHWWFLEPNSLAKEHRPW